MMKEILSALMSFNTLETYVAQNSFEEEFDQLVKAPDKEMAKEISEKDNLKNKSSKERFLKIV